MPAVFRSGPYAFLFFSSDGSVPAHVHVKRDRALAKFWLEPVAFAKNRGFKKSELKAIAKPVEEHRLTLLEAWDDYFGA